MCYAATILVDPLIIIANDYLQHNEKFEDFDRVKKMFLSCFKGAKLLQTVVIIGCFCVVVQQVSIAHNFLSKK